MQAYPHVLASHDEAFWVPKEVFLSRFDQEDFACRECNDVERHYLDSWFYDDGGKQFFILPVVQLIGGKTQFINGRHRLAVLLPHLDRFPVAFCFKSWGAPDPAKRQTALEWGIEPMSMNTPFALPRLPFVQFVE